jgi:DNA-binding response OmpR family regulator
MATKVLIVDDEENIVFSLSFLLKKEGFQIETAYNGNEAIEKYKKFKPDVILLDVMMPQLDGYQTAKKLRSLDIFSATHIIFLTAKGTIQDKQKGYISGADDYIVKPFENQQILEKIREIPT